MICANRHIRFLKMTEIVSSFLRRSAPEIIKKWELPFLPKREQQCKKERKMIQVSADRGKSLL